MELNKLLLLNELFTKLNTENTPLKLTIARNAKKIKPIIEAFTEKKENKFNELVSLDENGAPVLSEPVKKMIDEGRLDPRNGLPFGAYSFENENGLNDLEAYVLGLKKEEFDVFFVSVKLDKKIITEKGEAVELSELLDTPESKITPNALVLLMETGIIEE